MTPEWNAADYHRVSTPQAAWGRRVLARLHLGGTETVSTATFHWVLDHPALFRALHDVLKPHGRLVAQCGGAGNLDCVHGHTARARRKRS